MERPRTACLTLLLVVGLGPLLVHAAEAPAGDEVEQEVWRLEEQYISAFKNADHARILSFYHPEFLGWPDSEERPAGIKAVPEYLTKHYPQPLSATFEIDRAGIRVFGDVVITHYVLNLTKRDANGIEQTHATRITHTWLKVDGRWRILGGMSNPQ